MRTATVKNVLSLVVASVIGIIGIVFSTVAFGWVAGTLGISAAAASQIVTAIEVGGAALVAVGIIFGAGVVGAIIATVRYLLIKKARHLVVV